MKVHAHRSQMLADFEPSPVKYFLSTLACVMAEETIYPLIAGIIKSVLSSSLPPWTFIQLYIEEFQKV